MHAAARSFLEDSPQLGALERQIRTGCLDENLMGSGWNYDIHAQHGFQFLALPFQDAWASGFSQHQGQFEIDPQRGC